MSEKIPLSCRIVEKQSDDNGRPTHLKYADGYEEWIEYDSNGNVTYVKDSEGYECRMEYDEQNRLLHSKSSTNHEVLFEYDDVTGHTRMTINGILGTWFDKCGFPVTDEEEE